jgi:hypothetical protein
VAQGTPRPQRFPKAARTAGFGLPPSRTSARPVKKPPASKPGRIMTICPAGASRDIDEAVRGTSRHANNVARCSMEAFPINLEEVPSPSNPEDLSLLVEMHRGPEAWSIHRLNHRSSPPLAAFGSRTRSSSPISGIRIGSPSPVSCRNSKPISSPLRRMSPSDTRGTKYFFCQRNVRLQTAIPFRPGAPLPPCVHRSDFA